MIPIDERADTFPAGLQGTPFEEVYKALRAVAASVWAVDPAVYRAGMAWGWYALNAPDKLAGFRAVVVAALVSAFAPMIKDSQTDAELVEYLRLWRAYKPTFGALGELFSVFGASVEVLPISDEESRSVVPVSDTRLAFYLRITGIDFSRPLSLSEAVEIARRATPLGSRPFAYYAIPSRISVPCGPAPEPAFVFVENNVVAELPALDFILLDENGQIKGGIPYTLNSFTGTGHIVLQDASEVVETGTEHVALQDANEVVFVENEPEPEPEYEQINLYIPGGSSNTYYLKEGITSSSAWNPTDSYTKTLYDSSSMNSVARVRPGVRYESGYISNGEWIPHSVQSLADMPATTTSDSGSRKDAELFQTLGGTVDLWFVTNYSASGVNLRYGNNPQPLAFRLYPAQYIDVILALNNDGTGVTFSADDYWASNIVDTVAINSLNAFDVPLRTVSGSPSRTVIDRTAFENFTFVPMALYTNTIGTADAGADMSNFYCKVGANNSSSMYGDSVNIRSINAYNTTVYRWKCRITRINGGN